MALLAGENLLVVGPPGTAKSLIARRISSALAPLDQNQPYFEYLLTKFSTSEELFGPLSIAELKQDRFKRNTEGYLPTVQVAFLDEIFKASSSILNALLTILNERQYHNGTQIQPPLQAVVAASNELPKGQEELAALYDRFLVRRFVGYLPSQALPQLFDLPAAADIGAGQRFNADELADIRRQAGKVAFPEPVQRAITEIWAEHKNAFKENAAKTLSDRRLVKALHLLRVSAANGRQNVDFSDLMLLKDCLWNNEQEADKVLKLIRMVLHRYEEYIDADNEATDETAAAPATASPRSGAIKGYQGSGTESDPFLIEDINTLQGLERPEVGQQGHYFRQTADIDAGDLSSWLQIKVFNGHYDGGGHSIGYKAEATLFGRLGNSHIRDLMLINLRLAGAVNRSTLADCRNNVNLVGNVNHSTLSGCGAGRNLANNVDNATIQYCQSGWFLIEAEAKQSQISDCLVLLDFAGSSGHKHRGGIAATIQESQIARCWVSGRLSYNNSGSYLYFSGFADKSIQSTIHHCALGTLTKKGYVTWQARIVRETDNGSTQHNNSVIDSNASGWNSVKNSARHGQFIPAATFNQYHLKNTLDWDFDAVWQWDSGQDHPSLRPQTLLAPSDPNSAAAPGRVSLLQQQCRHNIWLAQQQVA